MLMTLLLMRGLLGRHSHSPLNYESLVVVEEWHLGVEASGSASPSPGCWMIGGIETSRCSTLVTNQK